MTSNSQNLRFSDISGTIEVLATGPQVISVKTISSSLTIEISESLMSRENFFLLTERIGAVDLQTDNFASIDGKCHRQ